jgi:hypothetical protein
MNTSNLCFFECFVGKFTAETDWSNRPQEDEEEDEEDVEEAEVDEDELPEERKPEMPEETTRKQVSIF